MNNYIFEYYQKIKSGEIIVGKWVALIYEMIVKGLQEKEFFFSAKKANKAIKFVENFCHHCEGRNDLIHLELWQRAALSAMFGIVNESGMRHFREVFLVVARKNGKTLFADAIIAYMAYLDGEHGAKIYCIAPKLEQAAIAYENFYQMVLAEPELAALARRRRSDIYISDTNTTIKPLAFNAKKSDGFNPHLVVADEIASWPGDAGLKQYEVMKSGMGARTQPLILSITTAGYLNDGIYDELMKRSTAVLNGSSRERRLLPLLYLVDDPDRWNDINELQKSNPNLGVSVSVDYLLEEIAVAENSLSKRAEFLTKYCNIKQNSSVAWLDYPIVAATERSPYCLEDFEDCYCVGGIDLSQTTDLTACSIVIERRGVLHAFTQFFMPAERVRELQELDGMPYENYVRQGFITPSGDHFIDYHDCFEWFRQLIEKYKIYPLKVGYDRYSAQYLVEDMRQYGFHMDDVFQGENLTPVIKEFEGILRDGNFETGANNLLRAHMLNVALKHNMETRRYRPVKIEQRARIDGFVSVIDAMTVRQKYYAEIGRQLKNER